MTDIFIDMLFDFVGISVLFLLFVALRVFVPDTLMFLVLGLFSPICMILFLCVGVLTLTF
jgi:hypothetical protein